MANNTGKKFGGRKSGTPNKLTKELRNVLKSIVSMELEQLPDLLAQLEPLDRVELLIKILPYVLPKVDAVNMNEGEPINWG